MKAELADAGFKELFTVDDVNAAIDRMEQHGCYQQCLWLFCWVYASSCNSVIEHDKAPITSLQHSPVLIQMQLSKLVRHASFPPSSPSIAL